MRRTRRCGVWAGLCLLMCCVWLGASTASAGAAAGAPAPQWDEAEGRLLWIHTYPCCTHGGNPFPVTLAVVGGNAIAGLPSSGLGSHTVDPLSHRLYMVQTRGGNHYLRTYDTLSGLYMETPPLAAELTRLVYETSTARLLGFIHPPWLYPGWSMVSVDPVTGAFTTIGVYPVFPESAGWMLDADGHRLHAQRRDDAQQRSTILTFDTLSGAYEESLPLPALLDVLAFEPRSGQLVGITAAPAGQPAQIVSIDPRTGAFDTIIPIADSALSRRDLTYDSDHHRFFTAETERGTIIHAIDAQTGEATRLWDLGPFPLYYLIYERGVDESTRWRFFAQPVSR